MYLFGSRARRDNRVDSDIDIFIESDEELTLIPSELLIVNGGSVDAFWLPNADGWADAVGTGQMRQLLCDQLTLAEAVRITAEEIVKTAIRVKALWHHSFPRGELTS